MRVCNMALFNLEFVLYCFKTEEMCDEAVHIIFPDQYKTKGICNGVVRLIKTHACNLEFFSDCFKTEDICTYSRVVEKKLFGQLIC